MKMTGPPKDSQMFRQNYIICSSSQIVSGNKTQATIHQISWKYGSMVLRIQLNKLAEGSCQFYQWPCTMQFLSNNYLNSKSLRVYIGEQFRRIWQWTLLKKSKR